MPQNALVILNVIHKCKMEWECARTVFLVGVASAAVEQAEAVDKGLTWLWAKRGRAAPSGQSWASLASAILPPLSTS